MSERCAIRNCDYEPQRDSRLCVEHDSEFVSWAAHEAQAERDAAVEKAEVLEAEVAHFTEERDAALARAEAAEGRLAGVRASHEHLQKQLEWAEARLEQVWAYQAQLAAKPLGSRVAAGIAAQLQRILADEEGELAVKGTPLVITDTARRDKFHEVTQAHTERTRPPPYDEEPILQPNEGDETEKPSGQEPIEEGNVESKPDTGRDCGDGGGGD